MCPVPTRPVAAKRPPEPKPLRGKGINQKLFFQSGTSPHGRGGPGDRESLWHRKGLTVVVRPGLSNGFNTFEATGAIMRKALAPEMIEGF